MYNRYFQHEDSTFQHSTLGFRENCGPRLSTLRTLPLVGTYWLVVASDDQVLIPPSSHGALVERVDDAHVRHLLESQQAAFVELHAVTAIWPDANHSPDDKRNLKERHVRCH